ncbi:MAG: 2,3-diaminopropionate biosynthesis protein SbnA [Sneathiella sp.]|nr:2,3-diaminopropionate biosynthesis protein SbnA [Sneathiella sp.]
MENMSELLFDNVFVKLKNTNFQSLYLKIEGFNAAGSIKMKPALGMIKRLEEESSIQKNSVLIESSSGSLGVALSLICAERGYRFVCVVDPNASKQNILAMKALGAMIKIVDQKDTNGGYLGARIAYIKTILEKNEHYLWLNQYANKENPKAHYRLTAKAITSKFPTLDYLFIGAGTTGTLMGCAQYFKEYNPKTKIIAVDSLGSVTFGHPPSKRLLPGLGTSRRPEIFSPEKISKHLLVSELDTIATCRYLAKTNGILLGASTGTVLAAIFALQDSIPKDASIVAISPDLGDRYLDTIYDDDWVLQNFGELPTFKPSPKLLEPFPLSM